MRIVIGVLSLAVSACGGSGGSDPALDQGGISFAVIGGEIVDTTGDDAGTPVQPVTAPVLAIPSEDEFLAYSFSIPAHDIECLDGSGGALDGDQNTFVIGTDGTGLIIGAPITDLLGQQDDDVFAGAMDAGGGFKMTMTGAFISPDGQFNGITYTLEGEFTELGWSGSWSWISNILDAARSCSAKTRFTGALME